MTATQSVPLFDFFSDRIEDAKERKGVSLTRWTTIYVAHLLVRVSRTRDLFREDAPETLAEIHLAARDARRGRAAQLYRYLGDRALSIAGYFPESLERSAVGVSYYAEMGESAYYQVARLSGPAKDDDPWATIFLELAHSMKDCIGLVADVAERSRAERTDDLGQLYSLWLRTQSPHAARRLAELGVLATTPQTEQG